MKILTQDNVLTDLRWWGSFRVDDFEKDTIELSDVSDKVLREAKAAGEPPPFENIILLANLPGRQEQIQKLFHLLQYGVHDPANPTFNVPQWLRQAG